MDIELLSTIASYVTDCIVALLLFIAGTIIVHCFYDDTIYISRKKAIVYAIVMTFSEVMALFFNSGIISVIMITTAGVTGVWGSKVGKGKKVRQFIRVTVAFFVCYAASYILSQMCIYCAGVENVLTTDDQLSLTIKFNFMHMLSAFFMLAVIFYLKRQYLRKGITMPFRMSDKIYVMLYCVYMFMMEIIYIRLEQYTPEFSFSGQYSKIRVFLALVSIAIAILIPILILRNKQTDYFNQLSEQHSNFLEAELAASKQFKEAQEETRAFRHDVQNNLSVVSMLMRDGKYAEAEQFINDMHEHVSSLSPKIVTGDEMLDSLIATKLAKINDENIDFTIDGVADGGIGWKAVDICTVFANAIDNAIEACQRIDDKNSRMIKLEFKKTAHQRLITLTNSAAEDIDCEKLLQNGMHMTSKADKEMHGYGVHNILRTVEKYGGMTRVTCTAGVFKLEMILEK